MRALIAILIALLLTACGFQLRGTGSNSTTALPESRRRHRRGRRDRHRHERLA